MQTFKMISLLLTTLFALLTAAAPLNGTNTTSGLRWTGEIPGHGMVTLHGSVNSVEQQIFALNPSLRENYAVTNPFMSGTPRLFNETEMTVSNHSYSYKSASNASIATRDDIDLSKDMNDGFGQTHWYCGNFATGSYEEAFSAIGRLNSPGGVSGGSWSVDGAKEVSPLTPNCERLVCSGSANQPTHTAVYWCNDNPSEVMALASVLSSVAAMVAEGYDAFDWTGCCLGSQNSGAHNQYSGQVFIGNGTNIVVGWGDCTNDDYFVPPSTYAYPGDYGYCV